MGIMRSALLWGSENRWLESQFRRRSFARKAVSRFMPGETSEAALDEAEKLAETRITTIVTQLGENVANAEEASAVAQGYERVLADIEARAVPAHVSVKLTHVGMDLGNDVALENLVRVARAADQRGSPLWVDMEYSRYVERTLDIVRSGLELSPNLGLCLQAYLHRTPADLEELIRLGIPVRLVKGAYMEPPEVAIPRKADVDQAFFDLALRLIDAYPGQGQPHGIATHDLGLIERIRHARPLSAGTAPPYEVQMLYGIQREAQLRLAREGVPVRVLISYGEAWFPWYMRRLAERPANVAFVLRSMVRA